MINGLELLIILIFGFLIFGPEKLPEIANTVMKAINKFRGAQTKMNDVIKTEVFDPNSDEPFKNPVDALTKAASAGVGAISNSDDKKDAAKKVSDKGAKKEAPAAKNPVKKSESLAERKAKYDAQKEKESGAEEKKPSVEELYGVKDDATKSAAKPVKKTVKRAPAKTKPEEETEKKQPRAESDKAGAEKKSAETKKPVARKTTATTKTADKKTTTAKSATTTKSAAAKKAGAHPEEAN